MNVGRTKSVAMARFENFHPQPEMFDNYSIRMISDLRAQVIKKGNEENCQENTKYLIDILPAEKMMCTLEDCEVTCPICEDLHPELKTVKACSHRTICSCNDGSYHEACKHQHILMEKLSEEIVALLKDPINGLNGFLDSYDLVGPDCEQNCNEHRNGNVCQNIEEPDLENSEQPIEPNLDTVDQEDTFLRENTKKEIEEQNTKRLELMQALRAMLHTLERGSLPDAGTDKNIDQQISNVHGYVTNLKEFPCERLKKITSSKQPTVREYMHSYKKSRRRKGHKEEKLEPNILLRRMIKNAPLDNPDSRKWCSVLGIKPETLKHIINAMESEDEQESFWTSYESAKQSWKCSDCRSFSYKSYKKGMIYCNQCSNWKHVNCCAPVPKKQNFYQCKRCNYELEIEEPVDSSDPSDENNSSDDFATQ